MFKLGLWLIASESQREFQVFSFKWWAVERAFDGLTPAKGGVEVRALGWAPGSPQWTLRSAEDFTPRGGLSLEVMLWLVMMQGSIYYKRRV